MDQTAERFMQASEVFGDHVRAVPYDRWTSPTPCSEWTVQDLVNHVVNEQLWAAPLINGQTIADVGSAFDGDLLGSDPVTAWTNAVAKSRAAFGADGAMDGIVHLSYGDEKASNYTDQMTLDALVHGWDLARAIGVNDVMPPTLVTWALENVEPNLELLSGSGMFGAPGELTDEMSDQARLLAMLGRSANWPT